MPAAATNRFVDPRVLAEISNLGLVAKTVVEGFVAGLHRSPDFGFSQEFAEYRAYAPGDDLRHVDWNVYARTGRAYLKRYRGETNTQIHVLLDASASMGFGSGSITKIQYAKYLASALVYLANLQRDSAGLIVFDDDLRSFTPPTSRQGQLLRLLHQIENCETRKRTDFAKPLFALQEQIKRRGMTVLISDFFEQPQTVIKAVEPLRFRGSEVILFHVLDPGEIDPRIADSALLLDMESGEAIETTSQYARTEYRQLMAAHLQELKEKSQGAGLDYFPLRTDQPLDRALREYLALRQGRL